jgi:hypothetical protein
LYSKISSIMLSNKSHHRKVLNIRIIMGPNNRS